MSILLWVILSAVIILLILYIAGIALLAKRTFGRNMRLWMLLLCGILVAWSLAFYVSGSYWVPLSLWISVPAGAASILLLAVLSRVANTMLGKESD